MLLGCVWLTISGVPGDYWLMDGEEILLPAGGRVVLEAYKTDCEFRLTGLPQECPPPPDRRDILCTENLERPAIKG